MRGFTTVMKLRRTDSNPSRAKRHTFCADYVTTKGAFTIKRATFAEHRNQLKCTTLYGAYGRCYVPRSVVTDPLPLYSVGEYTMVSHFTRVILSSAFIQIS